MSKKYKLSIIANRILREIELAEEQRELLKIGTKKGCHIRFQREDFFEDFELEIQREGEEWKMISSSNTYITTDGVLKLQELNLSHGDSLNVRYQNSGAEVLRASYLIDFESERLEYSRKIDVANAKEIVIGGSNICDILLKDDLVGTDTFSLTKNENGFVLRDNNTKYGIYLNGTKMEKPSILRDYDFASMVGYSFFYKEGILYTQSAESIIVNKGYGVEEETAKNSLQYPKFNKSTRIRYAVPEKEVSILPPEQLQKPPKKNILMSLIPALVMLGMTVVLRGIMGSGGSFVIFSVVSMSMGMIMSIVTFVQDKKQYKKDVEEREKKYREYISEKEEEIRTLRSKESEILEMEHISLEKDMETIFNFDKRLFEKSHTDDDFLTIRIGTGEVTAHCEIKITAQEFKNTEDELVSLPEQIEEKYHNLSLAPIVLPLKNMNAVGIVGTKNQCYDILKIITIDICARHYYKDVKLFYVFEEEQKDKFAWLRWLGHVNETYGSLHNFVFDEDSKKNIFEFLYLELTKRSESKEKEWNGLTHFVVFVYSPFDILKHPVSRFFAVAAKYGVTFLFFENYEERLPSCCDKILRLQENNRGQLVESRNGNQIIQFSYDAVTQSEVQQASIKLSSVYMDEISLESQLTKNITLFRLLGILNTDDIDLERRWKESKIYLSMAAPLGVNAKKDVVYLDLNEKHHGPHGLVAGTTGSGKSEILQSYILSMATLFHPYEVGFVIIDFKGGGMVNQFKQLPHLIGSITNIDGREMERSLKSIKAELRKRQEVFAQSGVNHVDAYIKLYQKGEVNTPLPHLILIVDEFAELKNEQPEFMKELISAARIGRSLGVHLILATQKPSGVVDAQIWSNSKFKLCLKVQTTDDSKEVLKTPLAAEIKEPGRAYLQVGNNEIFELFQSAYSGATEDSETTVGMKNFAINKLHFSGGQQCIYKKEAYRAEADALTQLDAIVAYVANYCETKHIERLSGICLPSLEDVYYYNSAKRTEADVLKTIVQLGIYDDPDNQLQAQINLDLTEGNTLIIGASQFGKTGMIQTAVRGIAQYYTPEQVHVYILDFGSRALKLMEELNHVGGVAVSGEEEKIKNLFRMLESELGERKEALAKLGITSFYSYKEAGYANMPHIILFLDNVTAFRELYPEYDDTLLNLCREGSAVGISIVMTSMQTAGIGYKLLANFANKICLYCNDNGEYSNMIDRCRMQPKATPGRGLMVINKVCYEFQTFLAFEGDREVDRVKEMKLFMQSINTDYQGRYAKAIPQVPAIITKEYVRNNLPKLLERPYHLPVGMDYEEVKFLTLDLLNLSYLAITGCEKSGKTNFLTLLFDYLQDNLFQCPANVYLIDGYERQLKQFEENYGFVEKYTLVAEDFELILDKFDVQLEKRFTMLQAGGKEALAEEPLLIMIVQSRAIFESGAVSAHANEVFKKIMKTYKALKVLFIFADVEDAAVAYGANELLKHIKENKNIIVFNDLQSHKITDISMQSVKKYKTPISLGDAYYITNAGINKIKTIKGETIS